MIPNPMKIKIFELAPARIEVDDMIITNSKLFLNMKQKRGKQENASYPCSCILEHRNYSEQEFDQN